MMGLFLRILNVRIGDLRKDMAGIETRLNDKIDGVAKTLNERIDDVRTDMVGVETRLNEKIDGVETRLTVRMDAHDHRFDITDERLRAVERGQGEVIGAVNMMQTIVVETLNREIDSERGAAVTAD